MGWAWQLVTIYNNEDIAYDTYMSYMPWRLTSSTHLRFYEFPKYIFNLRAMLDM